MSKYLPCETCPQRLEFQERVDHPEKMTAFIANDAPDPSDELVSQVISESTAIHEGMEAARPDCPGYRPGRMIIGMLADKTLGSDMFDVAEERHCNNPYLGTPEYKDLRSRLSRGSLTKRNNQQRAEESLTPASPDFTNQYAIPKFQRFIASLATSGAAESFVRSSNNALECIAVGGLTFALTYYGSEMLARRAYGRRASQE